MGKAMGKVPYCHVQGAMGKVVRQVHSTVVRLPDQTCFIRWPQVGRYIQQSAVRQQRRLAVCSSKLQAGRKLERL